MFFTKLSILTVSGIIVELIHQNRLIRKLDQKQMQEFMLFGIVPRPVFANIIRLQMLKIITYISLPLSIVEFFML